MLNYRGRWPLWDGRLEPLAPISNPPADHPYGDQRRERPPERQREICNQPQRAISEPEYLSLHISILPPSPGKLSANVAALCWFVPLFNCLRT
jgi:hypothetical protein